MPHPRFQVASQCVNGRKKKKKDAAGRIYLSANSSVLFSVYIGGREHPQDRISIH